MKKLCFLLVITILFAVCFVGCGAKDVPSADEDVAEQIAEEVQSEEPSENEEVSDVSEEENTPDEKVPDEKAPEGPEKPEETEKPAPADGAPAVDLNNVLNAIISGVGASDPLIVPAARLSDLYGIDASLVKQAASYVTIEGAFPDEIVIVEAVSSDAADEIQQLLGNRLSEVKEQSESYDPENYALAQKCKVGRKGNFVSLFLAPEHAKMDEIFSSFVK